MASATKLDYLAFLDLLLTLGSNLGPVVACIKRMVDLGQQMAGELKNLAELVKGAVPATPVAAEPPVALAVEQMPAEVMEAEQKLVAMSRQHGVHASKLGDGTLMRGVFNYLAQHPELLATVVALIKGVATGS